MRKLFQFGAMFDWSLLPRVLVESAAHGDVIGLRSWPFFVSLNSGFDGYGLHRILDKGGVKSWGWAPVMGYWTFRVRKQEAGYAQNLLLAAGVPLAYRMYGGESRPQPRAQSGRLHRLVYGR